MNSRFATLGLAAVLSVAAAAPALEHPIRRERKRAGGTFEPSEGAEPKAKSASLARMLARARRQP